MIPELCTPPRARSVPAPTRPASVALVLIAGVCGCGDDEGAGDRHDGGAAAPTWESSRVTKDTADVIIERVAYRSGGLLISGQVCRPKAAGRHKVLVYTHGGFVGITDGLGIAWNGGTCETLAQSGWVVLASSYRGEDDSEGAIEICLGEVDDVLEMTRIGLAQGYADTSRVALLGGSHGGCVGLRALQRGLPATIAVDLFGAKDWARIYDYWEMLYGPDDATLALLHDSAGGTPSEVPEAYAARSPTHYAADLASWSGSLLCAHGVLDELVPVSTTCSFVAATGGFRTHHLDESGNAVHGPPETCEDAGLTWEPDPPESSWPNDRYGVFFDGAGHGATIPIGDALLGSAFEFLLSKMP